MLGIYPELVEWVVRMQKPQSYLEIGVFKGETFDRIKDIVKRPIGVDIKNRLIYPCEFYEMTSDEFFKQFRDKVDIVFIDSDHKYPQLKKDFENSLGILNPGGTILIHDTDPSTRERLAPTSCADSYRIIDLIYHPRVKLDMVTFPANQLGITVVRRHEDRRVLGLL